MANPAAGSAVINRAMITATVMLATLMQALDTTIANVALPYMQGSLSATSDEINWVLTSYIVAAAIITPATGWLEARFGRKPLFLTAVIGFIVTSMLCGAATSLTQIVVFRLLQGIFGAPLVPLSQSVLLDTYPSEQQGRAMAVFGIGVMLGPILGPTLGGWLTDSYNWRWVFFINVPIGAIALFGVLTFLPSREPKHDAKFDAFGFATLGLAIGALQAMLDRGEQLDWFGSNEIVTEALVAAISFAFFIAHTATVGKTSFFKSELLKDRNFATGTFFIFIIGAVMYATRALLPPMLQNLMNYPVATTGLVTAPSGAGTMLAMLIAGRILKYVDARLMLLAGFIVSAFALWQMMHYTIVLSASNIVWPGVIQGFGLGLVFVPLSALTFSTLTPQLRADGTATYSLMRNIGSSIGISIVQTLMTRGTQVAHADLAANVNIFNPLMQPMLESGSRYDIAVMNASITQQAAMIAYLNDFKLMFVATLLVVPLLLLIRPAHKAPDASVAHAAMD